MINIFFAYGRTLSPKLGNRLQMYIKLSNISHAYFKCFILFSKKNQKIPSEGKRK